MTCCSKKKVMVLATGGTIAMKMDEKIGALVPACTGEDLVAAVPGLDKVAHVEVEQICNVASPNMTPEIMFKLHQRAEELLARDDIAGVVITHGTDTLEETSYFLDITHQSDKPIVLTAAMRGAGDVSPDGPANIYCAVQAAADCSSRGKGVMVCLNNLLHAAGEVMKTHSANCATFASPWWGPIGYVEADRIVYRRVPVAHRIFNPKALTARVDLIKAVTGSDRTYIDFAVAQGCKGIIVEGFGRGNIPPMMEDGISDACAKGVVVIISTRTPGGRVLDVYGYPGSVTDSCKRGAIMGGEISAAKARLKLILALSENPELAGDRKTLQEIFDE